MFGLEGTLETIWPYPLCRVLKRVWIMRCPQGRCVPQASGKSGLVECCDSALELGLTSHLLGRSCSTPAVSMGLVTHSQLLHVGSGEIPCSLLTRAGSRGMGEEKGAGAQGCPQQASDLATLWIFVSFLFLILLHASPSPDGNLLTGPALRLRWAAAGAHPCGSDARPAATGGAKGAAARGASPRDPPPLRPSADAGGAASPGEADLG